MEIYDISLTTLQGNTICMADFKETVLLVVNTASKCGFTPQFTGLQILYERYRDKGFSILGFPCNQFAGQEPGSEEEIHQVCAINYGVTFPMFQKIDVNGKDAHPLFRFLKERQPGLAGKAIKWNFTKFLIDGSGNPVKRYAPVTTPEKIAKDIEPLLI
nr:glutathione peroxidase [uncultured Desulfobacter sp.]